jgi:hypothetical protein
MDIQDTLCVQRWLKMKMSLAEVESVESIGMVDNKRFSRNAIRLFRLLWSWSAHRFSGEAGRKQDQYYARRGKEALNRRIERCQKFIAAFEKGEI